MDLLREIKQKIVHLGTHPAAAGVNAIVRHIERAEQHLSLGRASGDEEAANDVVYRTNQAFEGALKEAFLLLTDTTSTHLSTHQIEQQLLQKNALAPRVAEVLTNYRRQWRNPSTHDHRLVFRDQEAFLAIVSVSAFVSVLIDQMVEALNRRREKEEAERRLQEIRLALGEYDGLPFDEQVVRLLLAFVKTSLQAPAARVSEFEVLGRLAGFINSVDPLVEVQREPTVPAEGPSSPQPDLVLTKQGTTVVVELRRYINFGHDLSVARQQVAAYLLAGGWSSGVVFAPSILRPAAVQTAVTEWQLSGRTLKIHTIYAVDPSERPLDKLFNPEAE